MKKGINLITRIETKSENQLRYKKILTIIGTSALILSSLCVLVLLFIQIGLKNNVQAINKESSDLETKISQERDKEAALKALKVKSQLLTKISVEQSNANNLLQFLAENTPADITYKDISVPDIKTITFSGNAKTAAAFGEFLQNLQDEQKGKKLFSSLRLDTFTNGRVNDYEFVFSATVNLNNKKAL